MTMKIACLGGGGLYFVRPVADFALCEEMHGSTIVLYDIDRDRAELIAKMGRRFSRTTGAGLRFRVAETLREAVDGCDFVLTSIGGAGASGAAGYYDSPVHLGDKLICARHGIQQVVGDTAGPAAMMAAFRSIPIHLEICRAVSKYSPEAVVLNHANPMAVLCRAMIKYGDVQSVIGICHGVQNGIMNVARILDVPPEELETVWIGTNHYHWITRLRHQGKDIMPRFRKRVREVKCDPSHQMCTELSDVYEHWIVYPEDDHTIEFYPYLSGLDRPDRLPFALNDNTFSKRVQGLWDGSETLEALRQKDQATDRSQMLKAYAKKLSKIQLPEEAESSITGEGTARLITDIAAGRRAVHICNVPNQGAVANLPAEAVLEVEAVTDSAGVRPIWAGEAPLALEALLRKRIAWQEIVVDAAVTGNRKLALQAMQIDEGAIPPRAADKLLRELFANNKGKLPTFEKKSGKKR
jgi:alpha-galactosidase